jgi:hypothetical protein
LAPTFLPILPSEALGFSGQQFDIRHCKTVLEPAAIPHELQLRFHHTAQFAANVIRPDAVVAPAYQFPGLQRDRLPKRHSICAQFIALGSSDALQKRLSKIRGLTIKNLFRDVPKPVGAPALRCSDFDPAPPPLRLRTMFCDRYIHFGDPASVHMQGPKVLARAAIFNCLYRRFFFSVFFQCRYLDQHSRCGNLDRLRVLAAAAFGGLTRARNPRTNVPLKETRPIGG